jgi:hypothetical protein
MANMFVELIVGFGRGDVEIGRWYADRLEGWHSFKLR